MSRIMLRTHTRDRRGWWCVLLLLVVVCSLWFGGSAALAKRVRATSTPLPGSRFLGGNGVQANPAPPSPSGFFDWQGLEARGKVNHKADCPPPLTSPCPTASDDIFGGPGSGPQKDLFPGNWDLTAQNGGGATPSDVNILDSYWSFHHGTGDPFLYLSFTREASKGTSFIAFELNQVAQPWFNGRAMIPCRSTGDLVIAFEPHGHVLDNVRVDEWTTTTADPTTNCATEGTLEPLVVTPDDFQAEVNDSPIQNYLPPTPDVTTIDAGNFGEAAINLSAVLSGDQDGCSRFASIWMYSQSSSSGEPSDMKDYLAPTPFLVRTCKASPGLSTAVSVTVTPPGSRRTHRLRSHAARGKHRAPRRVTHRKRRPRFRATLGQTIVDTAHLTGGDNPTGTITFKVYGPNDDTCTGSPAAPPSTVPVSGEGYYNSAPFTPTAPGTYRWKVEYSGDNNNHPVPPTDCAAETVDVTPPPTPAQPTLTTEASAQTVLGNPIHDRATLSGGLFATGTITFHVYGPVTGSICTPLAEPNPSTRDVNGDGTYQSADFTPTKAGTYLWVASYSGDKHNQPAATSCGDLGESSLVTATPPPAKPKLTSTASPGVPVGSPIQDTAHLTGGSSPTGTITFNVYGPNPTACTSPAAPPSTVSVSGAGDYHSAPFTPTTAGIYRWVATYSGDPNNAAVATSCGDITETVAVTKAQPAISTSASPVAVLSGATVGDTALLTGGSDPTGTITFRLYGPDDKACSAPPAFVAVQHVTGSGSYSSPLPAPDLPGTYLWVATYSGDANNAGAATTCNEAGEAVVVQPAPVKQTPDEPTSKPKPKPTPKPKPRPTPKPKPKPTPKPKPKPPSTAPIVTG